MLKTNKGDTMKRTTRLACAIGVLALGSIGSVVVANPAQAKSHAHTIHALKAAHSHRSFHAAETDALSDGPGGHEDVGDNVDHQFDGSE
jgi:hypothetical protein